MVVPDLAQDRVAALGVQTGGRLVQHQHAGVHGHDARNRNAALLPARKLKRAFFQQLIGQADERGGLPDAALDLGLVQAHVARAVGDVAGEVSSNSWYSGYCMTRPTRKRKLRRSAPCSHRSLPSTRTRPDVGRFRPLKWLISVDFRCPSSR